MLRDGQDSPPPHRLVGLPHSVVAQGWRFGFSTYLRSHLCVTSAELYEPKESQQASIIYLINCLKEKIYTSNSVEKENALFRPSLVVQWLRICLPAQGTQVQSLVQEVSTCLGAAKPVHPQLLRPHLVHELQLLKPCSATREVIEMRSPLTTTRAQQLRSSTAPPRKFVSSMKEQKR